MSKNSEIVIKIENLSKVYQKKNENGNYTDFFALKNVNIDICKGDIVGIIGENGSGKSTLLKILSGITKPTKGKIEIEGNIASILDIGTGFHPDLSGRENVYLRGELLGLSKKEIDNIFDEIVDFSEIGDFIDTAVKHYSSGMFLRLAFSIIIYINSDILLLDEIMNVGDIKFRNKCESFIMHSKKDKTVLMVGHNINELAKQCNKLILFKKGEIILNGNVNKVVEEYLKETKTKYKYKNIFEIKKVEVLNSKKEKTNIFTDEDIINIKTKFSLTNEKLNIGFIISDILETNLLCSTVADIEKNIKNGTYEFEWKIKANIFNKGLFYLSIVLYDENMKQLAKFRKKENFRINKKEKNLWGDNYEIPFAINKKDLKLRKI